MPDKYNQLKNAGGLTDITWSDVMTSKLDTGVYLIQVHFGTNEFNQKFNITSAIKQ
jgi:hypothetical protein